jgi:hypothetical protein
MRASLAGEWRQARPTQRFAYLVGGALMLAGVAYLAAWLVVGGAWQGPVSFRNPATFGTSFGLTTNTLAWVTGRLRVSGRIRWLLLGPLAAVRAVAGGGAWFDPGVAPRLLERYRRLVASASRQEAKLASLTDREHDVLRLMPRGAVNAEIAVAMHVAEATVKLTSAASSPSSACVTELQRSSSLRPRCGHARRHATVAAQPSTHGGSETRAHAPMRIGDGVAAVAQSPCEEGAGSR